jgi:hypothetical protein
MEPHVYHPKIGPLCRIGVLVMELHTVTLSATSFGWITMGLALSPQSYKLLTNHLRCDIS